MRNCELVGGVRVDNLWPEDDWQTARRRGSWQAGRFWVVCAKTWRGQKPDLFEELNWKSFFQQMFVDPLLRPNSILGTGDLAMKKFAY